MSRLALPTSKLANFPFRLLPHFHFSAEEMEKTLLWENQFQNETELPTVELDAGELGELSKESVSVQSSPVSSLGDYVLIIQPSTILHPSALFIIKKQLKISSADLVYWDECEYSPSANQLTRYHRKGRPSFLSLLGRNVAGYSAVIKKTLWNKLQSRAGGGYERIWETCLNIPVGKMAHIPLSLSSLAPLENMPDRFKEVTESILNRLSENSVEATTISIEQSEYGQKIYVELKEEETSLGVVIPFKNQADVTLTCLRALSKQKNSSSLQVRLINNGSELDERKKIESLLPSFKFKSAEIIDDHKYFNFARLNNSGIRSLLAAGCQAVVLINNDVEIASEKHLLQLQAWSRLEGVGLVGGTLYYPSGVIQSAGINFSQVRPANVSGLHMHADKIREVDGLCFALVLITKDALLAVGGGLDEFSCPNGYGDALFSRAAKDKGFASLHVPWLKATHHESVSRGVRPEELELLELVQGGVSISDLWSDLEAEQQPMVIPLGPTASAFQAVVRQVSASRKLLLTAEAVCKPIVKVGKAIRKQLPL